MPDTLKDVVEKVCADFIEEHGDDYELTEEDKSVVAEAAAGLLQTCNTFTQFHLATAVLIEFTQQYITDVTQDLGVAADAVSPYIEAMKEIKNDKSS